MSSHRRFREGRVYFFTVVTAARAKILTTELARDCSRESLAAVRHEYPFEIIAFALLPDHLHTVWTLPAADPDYSTLWKLIKSRFTRTWLKAGGPVQATSFSRRQKGEHGVWQRRFFEQTCRDEADLKRCVDYIHVNPLKHGLVERVCDWPWSSFHRFVEEGEYPSNWGSAADWYGDEFRHFE